MTSSGSPDANIPPLICVYISLKNRDIRGGLIDKTVVFSAKKVSLYLLKSFKVSTVRISYITG
jgi:hypothetical protein